MRPDARRRAAIALGRHPGVVTVGLGASAAGAPILRVYLAGDADATSIPKRLAGLATEIALAATATPCSSTPTFYPGDQITRYVPSSAPELGTLGCLVRWSDKPDRFLLTNHHVLKAPDTEGDNVSIYKGEKGSCSKQGANAVLDDAHRFRGARLQAGSSYFDVDIAIAPLIAGIASSNTNSKIVNFSGEIRDLWPEYQALATPMQAFDLNDFEIKQAVASVKAINDQILLVPLAQRQVRKSGAITFYTEGEIVGICQIDTKQSPGRYTLELYIKPSADPKKSFEYNQEYTFTDAVAEDVVSYFVPANNMFPPTVTATVVDASNGRKTIKFDGRVFSLKGDSGSLVVDTQGKSVGLLDAGGMKAFDTVGKGVVYLPIGITVAQFIVPALAQLEDAANKNNQPGDPKRTLVIIPPGAPAGGEMAAALDGYAPPRDENQALADQLEALVGGSADGRRLVRIARGHLAELRNLIHHRRRVTVAWHRNKGPGYVAAIERSLRAKAPAPREIDGISLASALRSLRLTLMQEGSAALKDALATDGDWFIALIERSDGVEDALALLARGSAAATPCAIPILNAKGVSGAIGAALRRRDGRLILLGSHHVVHGKGAVTGDSVFAIDRRDGALVEIGRTIGGQLGRIMLDGAPVFADCAAILCHELHMLPPHWRERLAALADFEGFADVAAGTEVFKDGAATGRTQGRVVDIDFPDVVTIEDRRFEASGQILVAPVGAEGLAAGTEVNFCAPGDSGAGLFDAQRRLVGLIWGANANGEGIACPIAAVLQALALAEDAVMPALEGV